MTSKLRRLFAWENRILQGFTPWPTIVALLYFLQWWVFLYHGSGDIQIILFIIILIIFPAVCIISALVLLVRKKPKSFVSFIFPALLLVFMLSPWSNPVRDIFFHSRHYVEFHIQKRFYFPEMNDPDKLPPYKEWLIKEHHNISKYKIVYDLNDSLDEREKRKEAELNDPDWGYSITRVGRHFYMLHESYY
jgi:hypothetical protein